MIKLDTLKYKTAAVRLSAALALSVTAAAAQAHGIWFAQRSGDLALIYGHGAEDLDIIKRVPKVGGLQGFDGQGQTVAAQFRQTDRLLLVDAPNKPAVVATTLDNGLWSKTSEGRWLNQGRDQTPGASTSGHYVKYAVHIVGELAGPLPRIAEQRLQIMPMTARLPAKAGAPLRLQVLFDGKPVSGAEVLTDYLSDPDGRLSRTNARGEVTIRVRNQALNVVAARYESAPADRTKADKIEHYATLSFALPHKPE